MEPRELSDRIQAALIEVATWAGVDPRDWGRGDLDGAVEVWDRLDRLITDLTILRRGHGVVLAHRIAQQETAYTRDGSITVHRDTPRTERWDGHRLLGELADRLINADGEIVEAIPVDVVREITPACLQGQTSSRWKITALRKVLAQPEQYREVDYGDAVIARGPLPSQVRNARPRRESQPGGDLSDTEPVGTGDNEAGIGDNGVDKMVPEDTSETTRHETGDVT